MITGKVSISYALCVSAPDASAFLPMKSFLPEKNKEETIMEDKYCLYLSTIQIMFLSPKEEGGTCEEG